MNEKLTDEERAECEREIDVAELALQEPIKGILKEIPLEAIAIGLAKTLEGVLQAMRIMHGEQYVAKIRHLCRLEAENVAKSIKEMRSH